MTYSYDEKTHVIFNVKIKQPYGIGIANILTAVYVLKRRRQRRYTYSNKNMENVRLNNVTTEIIL